MKFTFFRQRDQKDCGPTCLKMICKNFGKNIPIESIRDYSETTRYGTSFYGLNKAASKLHLDTLILNLSTAQLISDVNLPVILHWNNLHFVVLYFIEHNQYYIADPAFGKIKLNKTEFEKMWLGKDGLGHAMVLETTTRFQELDADKSNKSSFDLLKKQIRSSKQFFTELLIVTLLITSIQFAFPFITQSIIDKGINLGSRSIILVLLGAQLFFFLGKAGLEITRNWLIHYLSATVRVELITSFFFKLMNLPLSFFDVKMTGDLIQRINDHRRIEDFLTSTSLNVLFSLILFLVYFIILFSYSLYIAGILLVGCSLYFAWVSFYIKKRKELDYKRFADSSSEQTNIIELIQSMVEIKINNAELFKKEQWLSIQKRIFSTESKVIRIEQQTNTGASVIRELTNIIIIFLAASMVISNHMTLGMMLAISYIVGQLNVPLTQSISLIQIFQDARLSMERLNEIHGLEEEKHDGITTLNYNSISVENISFRYRGTIEPILKNVSFTIPKGKITAIVGESGSGKSTLLKLLLQYYNPISGHIKFGERDLASINPSHYRNKIGVVLQDGHIFNDSIENNVIMGSAYEEEQFKKALITANIYDTIQGLPQKKDTVIGEEGMGLSTGQKQRILIARAIYKNPEIIFFDEATSALDSNNENIIVDKLNSFLSGRTSVIIAHRLNTIKNADNIVVLQNGRVADVGTHNDLISKKTDYYQLVKAQMGVSDEVM